MGPLPLKGILWWQGEANSAYNQTSYYACQFPALVNDWRERFTRGSGRAPASLFFGFVHLQAFSKYAAHNDTYDVPWFREAQLAALALPNVSAATAIDLGDPSSPYVDIHIRDKQPVGVRLAAAALSSALGVGAPSASPRFTSASCAATPRAGSGVKLSVVATFDAAAATAGLVLAPPAAGCPALVPVSDCSWLSILDSAGAWHNATAVEIGANAQGRPTVVFSADAPAGAAVRGHSYAWSTYPVPSLFTADAAHLPVLPWMAVC